MTTKTSEIRTLNIKALLSENDHYLIPIYQRNYAWEEKQIDQLIQDIIDYSIHSVSREYYIGTLVVARHTEGSFCTIDGQQRLTTLTILSAVIRNEYPEIDLSWYKKLNLSFESRKKSTSTLEAAFDGHFEKDGYEENIKRAYTICQKGLQIKLRENQHRLTIEKFADYLYKYVTILRVPLPDGTDLNHYFEVMNSRGEQLEKHEILKATLMGHFNNEKEREKYSACFNLIWEACANMERYVQYGFTVGQRQLIFGQNDWNILAIYSFDQLVDRIGDKIGKDESSIASSIEEILRQTPIAMKEEEKDEAKERFNTVIDFSNFLLHVLRVQVGKDEVALDDKNLLDRFEEQLLRDDAEKVQFVKQFIFNLLKCKFLFDKYIIKREFLGSEDSWSLKSLKWYGSASVKNNGQYFNTFGGGDNSLADNDNRRILMLLSMFHVSDPSMSYKYWMNAALNYLFYQHDVNGKEYIAYLEHIAKSFVFDRFLAKKKAEYFPMINEHLSPRRREETDLDLNKLRYKSTENNLIFNFCDYLLWMKYKPVDKNPQVANFEYAFRTSVEHYYPQTRFVEDLPELEERYLHSFGNLCLISHEKNSRLYNLSPKAKRDYYPKGAKIDSMKQYVMMKEEEWDAQKIEAHEHEMINLFYENLNSTYLNSQDVSQAAKWFSEYRSRDKNLLVRTLLSFGDYPRNVSGDRYELFDFDYLLGHECFEKFQDFVEKRKPNDLQEVIDLQLDATDLQEDYRYLFVKYPAVIDYCREGYFQWKDYEDGRMEVYLLAAEKNTAYKAKELYTYLLEQHFQKKFDLCTWSDNRTLYMPIWHTKEGYTVTETGENELQLEIWNEEGKAIHCQLDTLEVNGNSLAVKALSDFGWEKKESKLYRRRDSKLVSLGDNWEENLNSLYVATHRLFKNGLGIRLDEPIT